MSRKRDCQILTYRPGKIQERNRVAGLAEGTGLTREEGVDGRRTPHSQVVVFVFEVNLRTRQDDQTSRIAHGRCGIISQTNEGSPHCRGSGPWGRKVELELLENLFVTLSSRGQAEYELKNQSRES